MCRAINKDYARTNSFLSTYVSYKLLHSFLQIKLVKQVRGIHFYFFTSILLRFVVLLQKKTTCFDKSFFQLYLPLARYIATQLYSAMASDIVLRTVKGKYNITPSKMEYYLILYIYMVWLSQIRDKREQRIEKVVLLRKTLNLIIKYAIIRAR